MRWSSTSFAGVRAVEGGGCAKGEECAGEAWARGVEGRVDVEGSSAWEG